MKPETRAAKDMTDADLQNRRVALTRDIPRLQAELDAIQREHRRRKRAQRTPVREAA